MSFTRKRAKDEFGISDFSKAPKRTRLTAEWVHERAAAEHGSVEAARAKVASRAATRARQIAFDKGVSNFFAALPHTGRMTAWEGASLHYDSDFGMQLLDVLHILERNLLPSIVTEEMRPRLVAHLRDGSPSPLQDIMAPFAAREDRAARVVGLLAQTGLRVIMQPRRVGPTPFRISSGDVDVRLVTTEARPLAMSGLQQEVWDNLPIPIPLPQSGQPLSEDQSRMLRILEIAPPHPAGTPRLMDRIDAVNGPYPPWEALQSMLAELSDYVNMGKPHRSLADASAAGAEAPDMVPWVASWSKEVHRVACSEAHKLRVREVLMVFHRMSVPNEISLVIIANSH